MGTSVGFSLSFNGTYLGTSDYNVLLRRAPRSMMGDPDVDFLRFGGRDGGESQGAIIKPRFWTDVCEIEGDSRADVMTKMDNVKLVLDPRLGAKVLKYDGLSDLTAATSRQIVARINGPILPNWKGNTIQFNINWMAPSAHEQALSSSSETPTIDADPKTFHVPDSAAEVIGGSTEIRPVYLLENTSGGNVTAITLTSVTRTQVLRWTGILSDTHFIRIDANRQHIERSSSGAFAGEETSAMSGLTAGDPFPLLTSRVRNEFTLAGFSAANLTVTFTEEFL